MDTIVGLQEDLPQSRLPDRIVLQVEFVESMERVIVGVHIQGVDRELVGGETETLEYFVQCELLAITEDDDILTCTLRNRIPPKRVHVRWGSASSSTL